MAQFIKNTTKVRNRNAWVEEVTYNDAGFSKWVENKFFEFGEKSFRASLHFWSKLTGGQIEEQTKSVIWMDGQMDKYLDRWGKYIDVARVKPHVR